MSATAALGHLTHILLDGARMGSNMHEARERNKAHDSLYRGQNLGFLAALSPYLFSFNAAVPFGHWFLRKGWGNSWGVMLKTSWPLPELYKHFRKFLTVKTEEGRSLYFRFYDPRVLRIFLPTCDAAQLREFFGPVDYFVMEDEDRAFAIRYWHENGFLKSDRFPVEDVLAAVPEAAPLPIRIQDEEQPVPQLQDQSKIADTRSDQAAAASVPKPVPPPAMPVPKQEESLPSSRPKMKWNMFD